MAKRPMILLAEPEEATRESVEMVLTDEGYDCHAVADPIALLRAIHIHKCDLIIADINIIYNNIEAVISALKYYSNHPPILVILTYERIRDMLHMMKFNVTEYLLKPFHFEDMLERISGMTARPNELFLKQQPASTQDNRPRL